MDVEFSITTDLAGQKRNVATVFPAFRAAGFRAMHWCQDWTGEPVFYGEGFAEQVRQLADHNGLRVADIHGFSDSSSVGVEFTDELFLALNINRAQFAHHIGADCVVLHLPPRRTEDQPRAVEQSIAALKALRGNFESLGVRAAVENLHRDVHDSAFFDQVLGEFDSGYLGLCYDSGHAILHGQQGLLTRHGGRLIATHLHDNDGAGDQHRVPGEGKADWGAIVAALKACGYARTVNLEVHLPAGEDLEAFCRRCHGVIERVWRGGRTL